MNKMGDKELLKIKCPRKMSFRQEEWLNDMLQKGWLFKEIKGANYFFEQCDDTNQYIRICRIQDYNEELKVNPDFGKGKLIYRTGYNGFIKEYEAQGNGFFLFESENNEPKIDVSLHTKAIKMKEDVLRGKVQAIMALLYLIIILIAGNIKAFVFCSLLFAAVVATNVGSMWDYYKECRRVIKAAKMIE